MTEVVARAARVGKWWAIRFDAPTGTFHTQAKRLDQVEAMVRDILDMEGVDASVGIVVEPLVPGDHQRAVEAAREASAVAAKAVDDAATKSRAVVAQLKDSGYTVRDIGELLGVSPQRVSQLSH